MKLLHFYRAVSTFNCVLWDSCKYNLCKFSCKS